MQGHRSVCGIYVQHHQFRLLSEKYCRNSFPQLTGDLRLQTDTPGSACEIHRSKSVKLLTTRDRTFSGLLCFFHGLPDSLREAGTVQGISYVSRRKQCWLKGAALAASSKPGIT